MTTKIKRTHLRKFWDAEISKGANGKYELELSNYRGRITHSVVLHLDRYDVGYLAEKLWEIVDKEQKAVNEMSNALTRT